MNSLIIFMLFFGGTAEATDKIFNMGMTLNKPITLSKVQDLLFPEQTLTGSSFNVPVATGDAGAAVFNATGTRGRHISRSVVESNVILSASGATGTIIVDSFTLAGPTSFDSDGNASGLKVGGTAHIPGTAQEGHYSNMNPGGTSATFRVAYQ